MFRNIDILIGGYNLFQFVVYVKILYFCYSICCYNLFEDARKQWYMDAFYARLLADVQQWPLHSRWNRVESIFE